MSLLDKIFVVEGEEIEFRSEIKERMERVFNDAVEREHDKHFIDGVSVVLDTMNLMGIVTYSVPWQNSNIPVA